MYSDVFTELRPQLVTAESFNSVLEISIVQDKCSIINVCCFEGIACDMQKLKYILQTTTHQSMHLVEGQS